MRKLPLPSLIKKLDREFSRFIRMSHADEGGTVKCVTCGKLSHFKECHAGHFVSRRHMAVRWDERNVNPQCPKCNTFNDGALDEYSAYIIKEHGMSVFDELRHAKHQTKKWTRDELEQMIQKYQAAARELESRYE